MKEESSSLVSALIVDPFQPSPPLSPYFVLLEGSTRAITLAMKSLSSPSSLKAGNVLALLNTLYTSGFATASPGLPMLKDRTMHTLYAVSFIVYTCNCVADWIHVYCTLRGLVTSYPLETWLVIALVITVTAGSMLTGLLLVLCVENAFAHRLDIKPYRSGLTIIAEAVVEWIQAFNNFRVAFLIMALHDAPMTVINFFFLASCRCVGPQIMPWSLLISCATTNVSVVWRLTMLYFAYRRLICPMRNAERAPTPGVHRFPTPHEHFIENISTYDELRMREYDELWPIRWARKIVYGIDPEPEHKDSAEVARRAVRPRRAGGACFSHLRRLSRLLACAWLSVLGYAAYGLTCCLPCCYHYSCRRSSFHHRHAFARSCVRYSSYAFHYGVFFVSVGAASVLFVMNSLLLSSVHVLGSNNVPPEINQVPTSPLTINAVTLTHRLISGLHLLFAVPSHHLGVAVVRPTAGYDTGIQIQISPAISLNAVNPGSVAPLPSFDNTVCKPIWEDGGLGIGLKRKPAGPWQTRRRLNERDMLAVSTQVIINGSDFEAPFLLLKYDWAIIRMEGTEMTRRFTCNRGRRSGWNFSLPTAASTPFPYFVACIRDWKFEETILIECEELERMYPAPTPPPFWNYPLGKGAFQPGDLPTTRRKGLRPKEGELDRGDLRNNKNNHPKRKHGRP